MRPDERFSPDDPREWQNRARSNLARAKAEVPGAYLEDFCFDAQQAAEKAIKAVLTQRGRDFPYVHDLGRLLKLLGDAGEAIPESVYEAAELTKYALVTRYPAVAEPVTRENYRRALAIAEAVLRWAQSAIPETP